MMSENFFEATLVMLVSIALAVTLVLLVVCWCTSKQDPADPEEDE